MLADRTKRNAEAQSQSDPVRDKADRDEPKRDLVVVNEKQTTRKAAKPSRYADALFLAHMFASKFDAPQTRTKRRADPAEANATYRKSEKRAPKPGRVVSKKV